MSWEIHSNIGDVGAVKNAVKVGANIGAVIL
ncbi:hypothetical protein BCD70_003333 [Clostridium beijerinckii]|nr:hypothetical protein [Clostridium beijerinckii]NYC71234.1 hypothetical protein [Clostridium beijerinckii]